MAFFLLHLYVVLFLSFQANQSLSVRLRKSQNGKNNSGIVEVYDGVSTWGGICPTGYSTGFGYYEADVICKMLGNE